jgi:glycosyltransferase involved in cell wall biosynthesis
VSRGINRSRLAATWKLLFEALRAPYDHLIFVPWLTHGGADLVAINALNAAIEAHGPSSTLLIATDYERTDAIDWLPANAHFLSMSAFEPELKHEDRIRLVELLIYTVRPKSVLNVNSRACWDAFARRGIALSRISRLYAHLFCHDYGANDLPAGYAATHLRTCTNTISQVYFDNQRFLDEMDEELCLPSQLKERFKFLPQPMLTTIERAPKIIRRSPSNTVLWAGRFSRQKNIELLISIAKLCPELDFHVYGSGDAKHTEMLRESAGALRNLKTKGQFASADTLKVDAFSAFLFTSRWEGMPTILINLAARGIPIVASDVGGVRELVNERTGWLIESTVDPAPYAAALREAITSNALVTDKLENMMSLVHARHSWTTFKQALSQPDWLLGE